MAVVGNAEERWQERSCNYDGGTWTYTRAWLVKTDDKTDREDTVSGASGLPSYGEAHPGAISDDAYCVKIDYKQLGESPLAWIVTATYSSERTLNELDPTQDETLYEWDTEIYQMPILLDKDDNAVVNSAGDYFVDPLPQLDASRLSVKIKTNVASVPSWVLSTGNNQVNNASITIDGVTMAAYTAKTSRVRVGQRKHRFGVKFYPLSYEIHYRAEGWNLKPLDAGFRQRDSESKLVKITNEGDGEEPTQPVPLNGSGAVLTDPSPANCVFLDFEVYDSADLSTLPGIS